VTCEDNSNFLRALHKTWFDSGLISDTANLDFTAVPYRDDEDCFKNNWPGKSYKAAPSILAAIAHDPETRLICYGDAALGHKSSDQTVIEFLDFYDEKPIKNIEYIILVPKNITFDQLIKLDTKGVTFISNRRICNNLKDYTASIDIYDWKQISIQKPNNKSHTFYYYSPEDSLCLYERSAKYKIIRHIYIKNAGNDTIYLLITNDTRSKGDFIVRKYALRGLLEKEISGQINFFHLNGVSSGMLIKADFDFTISIVTGYWFCGQGGMNRDFCLKC
jgi:hypothetical protein